MRRVRAAVLALGLAVCAVVVVRVTTSYCFPLCALYDVWDVEYYLFQCWQCDPPSPEG